MLENTLTSSDHRDCSIEPYGDGLLIIGHGAPGLERLQRRWIAGLLASHGYLLLRGFASTLASFGGFVKACSSRITLDPARTFHGGDVVQKVDAGTRAMGLHLENGNSPFRPDLTWFFCERAARQGSQTTVCDGRRVWASMNESLRSQFLGKEIMYRRRVEPAKWKVFVQHQKGDATPAEQIRPRDLLQLVEGQASTEVEFEADETLIYSFRTPAVHFSAFGAGPVWANSIFGPSYNYEAPQITFGDGRTLPTELLEQLRSLTDELTQELAWQDGDIALIDNTRVMHGRRAIEDGERRIFNALSYIDRALLEESCNRPARND